MLIDISQARLQLGRGDHLRLRGAGGTQLTTINGIAWITVDRETGDTLVSAGDSYIVASDRTVLVSPLFSSLTLDVKAAADAMPGAERLRFSTGAWLRTRMEAMLDVLMPSRSHGEKA